METKQKMAVAGSGLLVASIGLGIVGAALIVPAALEWAGAFNRERKRMGFRQRLKRASKNGGHSSWHPASIFQRCEKSWSGRDKTKPRIKLMTTS